MIKVKPCTILVPMAAATVMLSAHVHAADAAPAGCRSGKNHEVLVKFADHQADESATDTTGAWLQFSATF